MFSWWAEPLKHHGANGANGASSETEELGAAVPLSWRGNLTIYRICFFGSRLACSFSDVKLDILTKGLQELLPSASIAYSLQHWASRHCPGVRCLALIGQKSVRLHSGSIAYPVWVARMMLPRNFWHRILSTEFDHTNLFLLEFLDLNLWTLKQIHLKLRIKIFQIFISHRSIRSKNIQIHDFQSNYFQCYRFGVW